MTARILGGYYLKARRTLESDVAHAPPHVREIWDFLLAKALFRDGRHLKRGEVSVSYEDILEALSWFVGWRKVRYSRAQCETAMKYLKKAGMVTTRRTTRGFIVTVCNYDRYQDPANYESHGEADTKTTGEPQRHDTTEKKDKNEERNLSLEGDEAHRILKTCEALNGLSWEQDRTVRQSYKATPRPLDWIALARHAVKEAALLGEHIRHPALWWRRRIEQHVVEQFPQKTPACSGAHMDSSDKLSQAFIQ